jgi:hypothetical protein
MTDDLLPQAPYGKEPAEQARHMGISVGDTIEGREEYPHGWNEARLTLLFLGEHVAVWAERYRTMGHPEWSEPDETAEWTLDARRWRRVATG